MAKQIQAMLGLTLAVISSVSARAESSLPAGTTRLPVLSYTVISSGPTSGEHPSRSDAITVDYELTLVDGKVIDSSTKRGAPATFPLNRLIPAWQVLVPLMRPGDDWTFYVPPEYAYGGKASEDIPANSFLIFRVKLISIGVSKENPSQ